MPNDISFKDDYFGGDCPVDVKVKVLKKPGTETISGQYIGFSKVYDEQRTLHNNKIECIKETLRICKEKGYLAEFLTEHEEEAVTMLTFLFDEQQERETYTAARDKEKIAEGRAEGIQIGEKKGIEIGKIKALIDLVKDGLLSITDAAKRSNMTESEFAELPDMKKA